MLKKYKSHKVVEAKPMTAGEYKKVMTSKDGNPSIGSHKDSAEGYLVVYSHNFRSWSPKKSFDEGYTPYSQSDKYTAVAASCALSASIGAALGACFVVFVVTALS